MHILHLSETSLDQSKSEVQNLIWSVTHIAIIHVGKTTAITDASSCSATPMTTFSNFFSCLQQGYDDQEGIIFIQVALVVSYTKSHTCKSTISSRYQVEFFVQLMLEHQSYSKKSGEVAMVLFTKQFGEGL